MSFRMGYAQMNRGFHVVLFGGTAIFAGTKRHESFRTSKSRDLLELLALNPWKSVSRTSIIDHLWPEGEPSTERNRLSVTMYLLRKDLESVDVDSNVLLETSRESIRLKIPPHQVDLWKFVDLVQLSRSQTDEEKIQTYAEIMNIYAGPLCVRANGSWHLAWQVESAKMFIDCALDYARLAHDSGNADKAKEIIETALSREPSANRALEGLVRWHLSQGDVTAAQQAADRLEAVIAKSGDKPSEYQRALIEQARQGSLQEARRRVMTVVYRWTDDKDVPAVDMFHDPVAALALARKSRTDTPDCRQYLMLAIMVEGDPPPADVTLPNLANGEVRLSTALRELAGQSADCIAHRAAEKLESEVARLEGFEPPTPGSEDQCSIH